MTPGDLVGIYGSPGWVGLVETVGLQTVTVQMTDDNGISTHLTLQHCEAVPLIKGPTT